MAAQGKELTVVILGAERTGKTALVNKYIHSFFSQDYSSSSDRDDKKQLSVDGQIFILNLVAAESSGEGHLHQVGQAFVLLYAINNRNSFTHTRQRYKQLKEAKGTGLQSTPVFLVGSKADLEAERQVTLEEGRQLAIELRCQKLFEISARNHTDEINDLFTKLVRQYLTFQQASQPTRPPMTPVSPTPKPMSPTPSSPTGDDSPRRGSVLERLKFGSLKRKGSIQSLSRKKSGSFSESIMSIGSARPSRDNVRSVSYGATSTLNNTSSNSNAYSRSYSSGTVPRKSTSSSPYRLDVNTSAWRDTIKWPTEIIPEEDLLTK